MADALEFYKMTGAGNDFIVADNRGGAWSVLDLPVLARGLCRRGLSIGADGLILVENSMRARFKVRIYNSDGSETAMCGNGARCAARFAFLKVIAGKQMTMEAPVGVLEAEICPDGDVRVRMPVRAEPPERLDLSVQGHLVTTYRAETGVPHLILFVNDVERAPLATLGPALRWHPRLAPDGANVDFLQLKDPGGPHSIRSYERGVEGETLACGTGVTAAAWVLRKLFGRPGLQRFATRSGRILEVDVSETSEADLAVRLKGEARVVYRGFLMDESLKEALT